MAESCERGTLAVHVQRLEFGQAGRFIPPQKSTHRAIILDDQLWNAGQTRPQEKAPPRKQKGKRQSRLLDAIETGVISVRDDGVSARI